MMNEVVKNDAKALRRLARQDGLGEAISQGSGALLGQMAGAGNTYRGTSTLTAVEPNNGELEHLYKMKGVAAAIVDRPAEDSLAQGVTIKGDVEGVIWPEFDRLNVMQHFTNAKRWARLYGGALIVMVSADGRSMSSPMDLEALEQIIELRVYAIRDVAVANGLYYVNPRSRKYGQPVRYNLTTTTGGSVTVHESRCIVVPGDPDPTRAKAGKRLPWAGRSVLTSCLDDLDRYFKGLFWSLRLLERKQQGIYKMAGLAETLEEDGPDENGVMQTPGTDLVRRRVGLVDLSRSVLNTVTVDAEDEYDVLNLGMDGVADAIAEQKIALSTSAAMPVTVLFGTSPSGLGATGEGELQSYNKKVKHEQTRDLKPGFELLVTCLFAQAEFRDKEPEDWEVVFNPLTLPSDEEQANTEKARAEAKGAYAEFVAKGLDAGLWSRAEGRKMLQKQFPDDAPEGDTLPPEPKPDPAPAPRPTAR